MEELCKRPCSTHRDNGSLKRWGDAPAYHLSLAEVARPDELGQARQVGRPLTYAAQRLDARALHRGWRLYGSR